MSTPTVAAAPAGEGRQMRADAVRNRMRVMEAALELFAEEGVEAGMEDIARRAGVGVGTVYRHFATKEALIEALVQLRFEQMRATLEEALERDNAWDAIVEVFENAALLQSHDRICAEMNDPREIPCVAPIIDDLLESWAKLIDRGHREGTLREDFDARDIPAMMCGLANVVMTARTESDWRRYLQIMLAGLRPAPVQALSAR